MKAVTVVTLLIVWAVGHALATPGPSGFLSVRLLTTPAKPCVNATQTVPFAISITAIKLGTHSLMDDGYVTLTLGPRAAGTLAHDAWANDTLGIFVTMHIPPNSQAALVDSVKGRRTPLGRIQPIRSPAATPNELSAITWYQVEKPPAEWYSAGTAVEVTRTVFDNVSTTSTTGFLDFTPPTALALAANEQMAWTYTEAIGTLLVAYTQYEAS